jgi:hypothetical protein
MRRNPRDQVVDDFLACRDRASEFQRDFTAAPIAEFVRTRCNLKSVRNPKGNAAQLNQLRKRRNPCA